MLLIDRQDDAIDWQIRLCYLLTDKMMTFIDRQDNVILVWPTSWTPAISGLFVCE